MATDFLQFFHGGTQHMSYVSLRMLLHRTRYMYTALWNVWYIFVSSVLKEIGWEDCPQDDLFFVEWVVKLCSLWMSKGVF